MQTIQCPQCQTKVAARPELAGTKVRCPKCKATFKVPGSVAASSDDDDWFSFDSSHAGASGSKTAVDEPLVGAIDATKSDDHEAILAQSTPGADTDEMDWLNFDEANLAPAKERPSGKKSDWESLGFPDLSDADLDSLQLPTSAPGKTVGAGRGDQGDAMEMLSEADLLDGDDDLGSVVPQVEPAQKEMEFRFVCPVCDTAHYARPSDVGKQIRCPDCTSQITVPAPPANTTKWHQPSSNSRSLDLKTPMVDRERAPSSPFTKPAADLLRDAEAQQLEKDMDDLYSGNTENPDVAKWFAELFRFMLDPGVILHFVVLSIIMTVLFGVFLTISNQLSMLLYVVAGSAVVFISSGMLCTCTLAILQSASIGKSVIERWPYFDVTDWLSNAFLMFAACVLSSLPGHLLGLLLTGGDPQSNPMIYLFFLLVSIWGAFPVVLLSMLDNESAFNPYSADVIGSFDRCKEPWGVMYFTSGLMFSGYFLCVMMMYGLPPVIAAVAIGMGLVLVAFLYARMLGQLAHTVSVTV